MPSYDPDSLDLPGRTEYGLENAPEALKRLEADYSAIREDLESQRSDPERDRLLREARRGHNTVSIQLSFRKGDGPPADEREAERRQARTDEIIERYSKELETLRQEHAAYQAELAAEQAIKDAAQRYGTDGEV